MKQFLKNKTIQTCAMFVTIVLVCSYGCQENRSTQFSSVPPDDYQRIISMSPSTTEILFALGLGDRVVGVTRFCRYPPQALEKKQIGGFLDPNYEAIVMLKPDLVITLPEFESSERYFEKLNIRYMMVNNKTIEDIISAIQTIGTVCNVEEQAQAFVQDINNDINEIEPTEGGQRPRILISIGRTFGTGTIQNMYIAGRKTLYDEMIVLAGGINAYSDSTIAYPKISSEGVLSMMPEIIFELLPDIHQREDDIKILYDDWNSLPSVPAVRNNAVFILTDDYTTIPGPRFVLLLRDMANQIQKVKEIRVKE